MIFRVHNPSHLDSVILENEILTNGLNDTNFSEKKKNRIRTSIGAILTAHYSDNLQDIYDSYDIALVFLPIFNPAGFEVWSKEGEKIGYDELLT
jgi:hypothetical protein